MENGHLCPAVVVHCMDFRFRKPLKEILQRRFPKGYDLISLAGGVKSLIEDGEVDNFELRQLELAHRLHHPPKIILIQHEDCGAYGGSKAFKTFGQELAHQRQQLQTAAALLKKHFPQDEVETYLIRISGELMSMKHET